MLPQLLSDIYGRYKEDTNVFATWLTNTARLCGYKSSARLQVSTPSNSTTVPASSRLKGNARKEEKASNSKPPQPTLQANKHFLATEEIIVQAGLIADHKKPVIKVPLVIQDVLRRAIRARKRCTLWFRQMASNGSKAEDDASNSSHEHFIRVLERAFTILEPHFEKSKSTGATAKQSDSMSSDHTNNAASSPSNRFQSLEVEDTTDQDLDIKASDAAVSTTAMAKLPQRKDVDIYELERSADEELQFRVFCFFEDLHRMRTFLGQTWQQFAAGKIDLSSAAIVTDVALALLRETEEEIKLLSPKLNDEHSYRSIVSVIHPVPAIADSYEGAAAMLKGTPLDHFVFRPIFVSMLKSIGFWGTNPMKSSNTSMIPISHLYLATAISPQPDECERMDADVVADDHFTTLVLLDSMNLVLTGLIGDQMEGVRRARAATRCGCKACRRGSPLNRPHHSTTHLYPCPNTKKV